MNHQLAFIPRHVGRKKPQLPLEDQFAKLVQFAVDNHLDDAVAILQGMRSGRFILAPNVESFRVDI